MQKKCKKIDKNDPQNVIPILYPKGGGLGGGCT